MAQEPMTDDEFDALDEPMDKQAEELRESLADNLGGEPEDYRRRPVADGGE
jgi:hypothetical protein